MKSLPSQPIGVYDSGVGGFTVLRELQQLLPGEDFLYFGDSANCPFGNRSDAELLEIGNQAIRWFQSRKVKLLVAACNTISALWERYPSKGPVPILGIIPPIARQVGALGLSDVGLIATQFTVASGCYERMIGQHSQGTTVWGQGSHHLARLIDQGKFDGAEVSAEVSALLQALTAQHPVSHVILGCTHYPIVEEEFCRQAPDIAFLNPAKEQAQETRIQLEEQGLLNPSSQGSTHIYTSGDTAIFEKLAKHLGIQGPIEAIS